MGAGADAYAEHPEIGKGFTPLVAAVDRCASGYPSCVVQQAQLAVVRCLLEEFKVTLKPPGLYGAASRPLISTVFTVRRPSHEVTLTAPKSLGKIQN